MKSENNPPIFIGGLMKSGTSLYRKLISSHISIFGGLETHWFCKEFTMNWQDTNAKRTKWLMDFYDVNLKTYRQIALSASDPYDFIDKFLIYCTKRAGKKRFIEKTPDNILHLDLIWKQWPDAKVIHVLREPKDVYSSWKRNNKRSINYFLDKANNILQHVKANGSHSGLLNISYEELINDQQETLKKVFSFLNEKYYPELAIYEGDDSDFKKVLEVTGKKSATTLSLAKPIFSDSIGQWERILTIEEKTVIEEKLKEYISYFGH